ncbi:rhodanese-like domain-containing protein [Corynebacterium aquilae]|uniref:Sulfurtransferase n=1 Tax=Corynebacterium aquilae DSM 44791 TaxID=1431546 RepID=A0A1L7CI64_9CORY|nr:rhodanese-like domain-containing protein [Corynebacterium aquilae]APT85505.1 sulfurtransferase [Corynebacterium aquilae DSM 44791]
MQECQVTEVPEGAQLIDVREPDEFANVHAVGAVNVPLAQIPSALDQIDQTRPLFVICQAGGRSARACQYLEQAGIHATNVAGGTSAWVDAGLPTE